MEGLKPIYGLRDATKYWHNTFKKFLGNVGARESIADPAMFYWSEHAQESFFGKATCKSWGDFDLVKLPAEINEGIKKGKVFGCIAIHVDDIAISGRKTFADWFTIQVQRRFDTKEFSEGKFCHLGMQIEQLYDGSILTQAKGYESGIAEIGLEPERIGTPDAILDERETHEFRSSLGKLMWIARLTRPDLAFGSAAAAQKYADEVKIFQEYMLADCEADTFLEEEFQYANVSTDSKNVARESSQYVSHMPGFGDKIEGEVTVRKVILGKKKAEVKPQTHIKVKNAVFLNKAIRKLKARSGFKAKFADSPTEKSRILG